MLESALVIYSGDLISVSKGKPASVDFNFDEVWSHRRKVGKRFDPSHLYWVHVHPPGFGTGPSSVDQLCAESLNTAFGGLGNFGIICFSNETFSDILGLIAWYQWDGKKLQKVQEHELALEGILLDEELYMLKALSYGEIWSSPSTVSAPSAQTSLSSSPSNTPISSSEG